MRNNQNNRRLTTAGLLIAVTTLALLPAGPSHAQVAGTASPLSASPLYMPGSPTSGTTTAPLPTASPTGIPLGASEIDPGGLSTTLGCSNSTGTGTAGLTSGSSSFDGGGLTGTSMNTNSSTNGSVTSLLSTCTEPTPTTSPVTTMQSTTTGSSATAAGIPLGSTELNNAGVSQIQSIPSMSTTTSDSVTNPAVSIP